MSLIIPEYQTTELRLAAALTQMGCKFVGVLPVEERGRFRCIFVIGDVPQEYLDNYAKRQCFLEVIGFHEAIKHLSGVAKRAMPQQLRKA